MPRTGLPDPSAAHLDGLLALLAEDAGALGCAAEVEAARGIASGGTSADEQARSFAGARGADWASARRSGRWWTGWPGPPSPGTGGRRVPPAGRIKHENRDNPRDPSG